MYNVFLTVSPEINFNESITWHIFFGSALKTDIVRAA